MKEDLSESRIDYEEAEEIDLIPPNYYTQPSYSALLPPDENFTNSKGTTETQ